jgi:hypothetical protein
MGMRRCRVSNEPLDKWFIAKVAKLDTRVEKVVSDMTLEGQDMLKDMIRTRGTGKTWSRTYVKNGISRSASRPGRVWTGDMLDNIEEDVNVSADAVMGSFGWINTYEDYYGLQDVGFTQSRTGIEIAGMFAMADAADWARIEFKKRMKVAVREF